MTGCEGDMSGVTGDMTGMTGDMTAVEGPPPAEMMEEPGGMDALDGALGGDPVGGEDHDVPPADDPMGDSMDASLASQDGEAAPADAGAPAGMPDDGSKPEDDEGESAPTFDDAG